MQAVDCQGLAGAFTLGTKRAGFDIVAKLELPGGFGVENCEANRHLLGDFETTVSNWSDWPHYDVPYIFGNPPCSGFSLLNTVAAKSKDNPMARGPDAKINDCMWALIRYAGTSPYPPEFVVFESVQGAFKQGRSLMQALRNELEKLTNLDYTLTNVLMSGATAGACSIRNRFFFVAHRGPFGVEVESRPRVATYRDAMFDLVGLDWNTWEPQRRANSKRGWLRDWNMLRKDGKVDAHVCWSEETTESAWLRRHLAALPWWEQGMGYQEAVRRAVEETGKWPGPWAEEPDFHSYKWGFNQPSRIPWDRPAFVVTGGGAAQFIHPDEPRFLTVRELSRIQGFPDTWSWEGSGRHVQKCGAWIGKGVPVQSGQWISQWVYNALDGEPGSNSGEEIGERERLINVTHDWKEW